FTYSRHRHHLHSFPTRRSSDLAATGLLSADEISGPLRSILSRQNNIDVLLGEVTGVDTQKRVVRLEQHDVPYDFLILATGVQYKDRKSTRLNSSHRTISYAVFC